MYLLVEYVLLYGGKDSRNYLRNTETIAKKTSKKFKLERDLNP